MLEGIFGSVKTNLEDFKEHLQKMSADQLKKEPSNGIMEIEGNKNSISGFPIGVTDETERNPPGWLRSVFKLPEISIAKSPTQAPDNDLVYWSQKALNKLDYTGADNFPLKTDGWLGENTSSALKNFQSDIKLPSTGELDGETYDKLLSFFDFNGYKGLMNSFREKFNPAETGLTSAEKRFENANALASEKLKLFGAGKTATVVPENIEKSVSETTDSTGTYSKSFEKYSDLYMLNNNKPPVVQQLSTNKSSKVITGVPGSDNWNLSPATNGNPPIIDKSYEAYSELFPYVSLKEYNDIKSKGLSGYKLLEEIEAINSANKQAKDKEKALINMKNVEMYTTPKKYTLSDIESMSEEEIDEISYFYDNGMDDEVNLYRYKEGEAVRGLQEQIKEQKRIAEEREQRTLKQNEYIAEYTYPTSKGTNQTNSWTLSDDEFLDSDALTQEEITQICNYYNPGLTERGFDTAIYNASKEKGLNPIVLLTTIGAEQSLCKSGGKSYNRAFGISTAEEVPLTFNEDEMGGLDAAVRTYLGHFNTAKTQIDKNGKVTALNRNSNSKQEGGDDYTRLGFDITPVNAAMYSRLKYNTWLEIPEARSYPLSKWLEIYQQVKSYIKG